MQTNRIVDTMSNWRSGKKRYQSESAIDCANISGRSVSKVPGETAECEYRQDGTNRVIGSQKRSKTTFSIFSGFDHTGTNKRWNGKSITAHFTLRGSRWRIESLDIGVFYGVV
ncbi:MAG: hypothetical protein DHS20C16_23110 [Phycisphaerae bacterium]|nr:MAG: hypothetical protein DHS20C16_23110 [Phycisphaerae bacterium]